MTVMKKIFQLALVALLAAAPAAAQKNNTQTNKGTNELGQTYDKSTKIGNGVKSDKHAGTNFSDEAAKKGVNIGGRAHSTADQQHGPKTWFGTKLDSKKEDNSAKGLYAEGRSLYDKGEYAKGIALMEQAAEQNVLDADLMLGYAYMSGLGVDRDMDKAVKYYGQAADLGDATAAYNLGTLYYNGQGVERNFAEAAKWFEKAAAQGNGAAAFNAAGIYENGTGGTEKKPEKAIELYRIAAKNGISPATQALQRLGAAE